jgi:hypothetical protein
MLVPLIVSTVLVIVAAAIFAVEHRQPKNR